MLENKSQKIDIAQNEAFMLFEENKRHGKTLGESDRPDASTAIRSDSSSEEEYKAKAGKRSSTFQPMKPMPGIVKEGILKKQNRYWAK